MRLKNKIQKVGYFWSPSNPDIKMPGTLTIRDGAKTELEVINQSHKDMYAFGPPASPFRVVGHIEQYGLVTLEDCLYKTQPIASRQISKARIIVTKSIMGLAYDENEELMFNGFRFSIEGIDEWVAVCGINAETVDHERLEISFSLPDEVIIDLKDDLKLKITYTGKWPTLPIFTEAECTQKTYFKVESKTPKPLGDFISIAYKLTTLLCFAIDQTVCIDEAKVYSAEFYREHEGKKVYSDFDIFYPSRPYVKEPPKIEWNNMLFNFAQIKDADAIIGKWFEAYEEIRPSLDLYFSTKVGAHKYIDSRFLALAQGIETYHRRTSSETLMDTDTYIELIDNILKNCPNDHKDWLNSRLQHGNEIPLGKRIKRIIEPFKYLLGNSRERNKLIRLIVDTRNYLTHYSENLAESAASGKQLVFLCYKMEAIFQLHLLQVIGFTADDIRNLIESNFAIRQKIRPFFD